MLVVRVKSTIAAGLSRLTSDLSKLFSSKKAATAIGRETAQLTKDHFFGLAGTRHRKHVALNFWEDAADSVSHTVAVDGVRITVDKPGVAQRYYGGTIQAKNFSHLWIPATSETEGKAPGEFGKMFKLINPQSNRGVALLKGKKMFYLVPEVTQAEDKSVMPTNDEYEAAAQSAVDALVDRILEKR
ncbi:MAG: hypothetical protein R6X19_08555 [Kiritimatiellia bacterium]